jgi:hypothetical protein
MAEWLRRQIANPRLFDCVSKVEHHRCHTLLIISAAQFYTMSPARLIDLDADADGISRDYVVAVMSMHSITTITVEDLFHMYIAHLDLLTRHRGRVARAID